MAVIAKGIRLTLAYDGTDFCGWQRQQAQRTVQNEIEQAISSMAGHEVSVRAASRTDSGVHALGQEVAFDTHKDIELRGWRLGLNTALAKDISVVGALQCEAGYNPRFDTVDKSYRYLIEWGETRNPLMHRYRWHVPRSKALDIAAMQEAAAFMVGTQDYRAFQASSDYREKTIRTISAVRVLESFEGNPKQIAIEVRGTAFLQHMVRIMVGTLVEVGRGKMTLDDVKKLFTTRSFRQAAGPTAPAHGLTLLDVRLGRIQESIKP